MKITIIIFIVISCIIGVYLLFLICKNIYMKYREKYALHYDNAVKQDHSDKFNNIPIYYINLDRSPERKNYMENQFKKYHIQNTHRISAIDGKSITNKVEGVYRNGNTRIEYSVNGYNSYSKSELACVLSHLLSIQTAYLKGDEVAIIMEDDVGFGRLNEWGDNSIFKIINKAPKDWTIISLDKSNPICSLFSDSFIPYNYMTCFSAAIYIINRKGMENVLNHHKLNKFMIDYKNDKSYSLAADWYIYKTALKAYTYTNGLFYQNKSLKSQIEHEYERY